MQFGFESGTIGTRIRGTITQEFHQSVLRTWEEVIDQACNGCLTDIRKGNGRFIIVRPKVECASQKALEVKAMQDRHHCGVGEWARGIDVRLDFFHSDGTLAP